MLQLYLRGIDSEEDTDKELSIDKNKWENIATDRSKWRSYLQITLKVGEENIIAALENKHRLTKENLYSSNIVVASIGTNGDP